MSSRVDRAVAKVAGQQKAAKAVAIQQVTLGVVEQPIVVRESGDFSFTRGAKSPAALAHILVFDEAVGAYRAVLTPPGSSWELVTKKQGPQLWRPGADAT